MIIAIDGPAASGKSTIAKLLADKLGYQYMDTGAMYRALAWKALENKVDISDAPALSLLAKNSKISIDAGSGGKRSKTIYIDGIDVTRKIRSRRIENTVSLVAKVPGVRQAMVEQQRIIGRKDDFVVEGRDIGTVVFPEAEVKLFIIASTNERARRRQKDLRELGHEVGLKSLEKEIIVRDKIDSTRDVSPLLKAQDAFVIDTSGQTVVQTLDKVMLMLTNKKNDL